MQEFLGDYDYSLDPKNRLSIPVKYRNVMENLKQKTFILSRFHDIRLTLYPYSTYQERIAKRINELPQLDDDANELRRYLGLSMIDVKLDSQGRINIPPAYCQHAGIEKKVKIIGCSNKIELWNPESYAEHAKSLDAQSIKEELKKYSI
ncbi:MAG: division/cell wall cluster transcriptional repressor MraZ [bacterium]